MASNSMQHTTSQTLVASATMQMNAQVLQASNIELMQIANRALETNPMLEESPPEPPNEEDDWDSTDDWTPSASSQEHHDFIYESITHHQTLHDFLHAQIAQEVIPPEVKVPLSTFIDSLNDNGLFEEAPQIIAMRHGFDLDNSLQALKILHELDPPGVGAQSIQESLLIQLKHLQEEDTLAHSIIAHNWDLLSQRKFKQIARLRGVDEDDVMEAVECISHLNPHPGSAYSPHTAQDILPDILIELGHNNTPIATLTGELIPHLRINREYQEMLSESVDSPQLRQYLKHAFKSARELITAIDKRQQTILNIAQQLIILQQDYFLYGLAHLQPLSMQTVADTLGIHVSTVSRACNDKYLLSRWGVRELSSFFSAGSGGDSTLAMDAILEHIRHIIAAEPLYKPLSDATIAHVLTTDYAIPIARRTVAKYREQLHILPASLRRAN